MLPQATVHLRVNELPTRKCWVCNNWVRAEFDSGCHAHRDNINPKSGWVNLLSIEVESINLLREYGLVEEGHAVILEFVQQHLMGRLSIEEDESSGDEVDGVEEEEKPPTREVMPQALVPARVPGHAMTLRGGRRGQPALENGNPDTADQGNQALVEYGGQAAWEYRGQPDYGDLDSETEYGYGSGDSL